MGCLKASSCVPNPHTQREIGGYLEQVHTQQANKLEQIEDCLSLFQHLREIKCKHTQVVYQYARRLDIRMGRAFRSVLLAPILLGRLESVAVFPWTFSLTGSHHSQNNKCASVPSGRRNFMPFASSQLTTHLSSRDAEMRSIFPTLRLFLIFSTNHIPLFVLTRLLIGCKIPSVSPFNKTRPTSHRNNTSSLAFRNSAIPQMRK